MGRWRPELPHDLIGPRWRTTPHWPRGPTRILSYAELSSARGITFSRRHLQRLEDGKKFPMRVRLGENRIGWVETEIDEWLSAKVAARNV
ncbi:AlpA family phage regulatory protein [Bradyrhizobium sp. LA2.1]|uniref:helix-turn-helix transcriptional regulator n=1 Tax=Bradyrhizobium sp. LA2.1 TaxID=3156376 RepID=UPI0033921067